MPALAVAANLTERGATVRVLDLPGLPPKGDVIDWVAAGGTVEKLHDLITASPNGQPSGARKPAFPLEAFKDIFFDLDEECRVDGLLPLVGLACLYGLSGAVKSFILLDLFLRIARGASWAGREIKQCAVIYIAAEGGTGTKKRIAAMRKVLVDKGLSTDVPFYLVTVAPNLGTGEKDRLALIANIEAQLPGIRPGAIAIDTTAQAIGGADENGAGMDALVVNATALVNHFQCLVAVVHHTPVADDERLRGKGTLGASVDVSILSKYAKGSLVATLTIMKMRDDDGTQSFTVRLARVVLGKTKKGREVSTLVVESVEPGAAEDIKQDKRKAAEILRDEFVAAYDRLTDGAPKSLGLDDRSSVLKVPVDKVRDELKSRGFLETDEKGNLSATARSHFQRVKAELVKTKGGKFAEEKGLIWRV
jgi:hypothetical protein